MPEQNLAVFHAGGVFLHIPLSPKKYLCPKPLGKGVDNAGAHTVKAAREGIVIVIKLAASVKLSEHNFHAGASLNR